MDLQTPTPLTAQDTLSDSGLAANGDVTGPGTRAHRLVSGAVAAASALAIGELLAGASKQIPSLIRGVGDVFVDYTPGDIVRTSIENLGSSQKPALLWGIGIAAVVLGALLGQASRRDNKPGLIGFALFGLIGGWAAARVPLHSAGWSWFTALLAMAVGMGVFVLLMNAARRANTLEPADMPDTGHGDRRRFLGFAGFAGMFGLFGLSVGRWMGGNQNVENARELLATRLEEELPTPVATPLAEVGNLDSVPGISTLITPNDNFYRIDTALVVPQIDPNDWHMTIKGMVDNELRFTLDDLLAMEQMTADVTLSCVSNEVGGTLVGNARWTGVRLSTLLDMAGVQPGATQIASRSWDDWDCGFPTEIAFDGRDAMVAILQNGEPLPIQHGFPARLVIPGLYGYVSATKWLKEIELTTLEDFDGYWIPRGWSKYGPIKTQSRIDVPTRSSTIPAGQDQAIAGVAWGGIRSISKVEVRVDGGQWIEATLGESLADATWRQWMVPYNFAAGDHEIQVRATDGDDITQGEQRRPVAPDGAEGWHTIRVRAQ